MKKNCIQCDNQFIKKVSCSKKSWKLTKFCSRDCMGLYKIGKPFRHSGQFQKKHIPWNKGKKQFILEYKHYAYKGSKVSYSGLHHWVKKHLGSPETCRHCGKTELTGRTIHWANKSGKYKRDLSDWIRLCVDCHRQYDKKLAINCRA